MRLTAKLKENLEANQPTRKRSYLELAKDKEQAVPIDYFKEFKKEKIVINENRSFVIESVRKGSGVKVFIMNSDQEPKEEILKSPIQLAHLKKLVEWSVKNNTENKGEGSKEITGRNNPEKPEHKKPKLELVEKNFEENSGFFEEIDLEKRTPENMEKWKERIRMAQTISEVCDVIDEIGYTKVNQEIVHPAAMRVRLEILKEFSSEGLIKWKLEEITKEFEIRKRVMEMKIKELEETSGNVVSLDMAREEKSKKKVNLEKLKEEMNEARAKYEDMFERVKNLIGHFKTSAIPLESKPKLEKEVENLRERYKDAKKRYEEAILDEN